MKKSLARCIPAGLAARFALLLASTLVVANLATLGVLTLQQRQQNQAAQEEQQVESIVALVSALESVTAESRAAIARSASNRMARVNIDAKPLVSQQAIDARSSNLRTRLTQALGSRNIQIAIHESHATQDRNRHYSLRPHSVLQISIELNAPANAWLNVTSRAERYRESSANKSLFLLILVVSLVAVLGVGLLFVRRLTQPLNNLAQAARAAGRGDRSVRVAESGAREVRDAAAAFNAMQTQIASFDAERTRTLAAVGHDLRTPITSLRIRAEMLEDEAREPMIRTLEEMTVMADGLVAFARGDGQFEKKETIELDELLSWLCKDRCLPLSINASATIFGRRVELTRAIGNLINNAIRYGTVAKVSLSCNQSDAIINIDDEGPGIPAERLDDIFEPFVRGDSSRSSETGGIGLGLSIAQKIIREHGGTLELTNRDEHGLRVTIMLPLLR